MYSGRWSCSLYHCQQTRSGRSDAQNIKAGPHTRDVPKHVQPAMYFPSLAMGGDTYTVHVPRVGEKFGRPVPTVTGRGVGGGSAVNFMLYTRASASDYDDWETVHGNKGWGSKSLIPLLRKAETYQAITTNDTHGKSGPIKVSFAKANHNVGSEFLEAAAAFDKERGPIDDLNALYACDGYGRWARFIDGKTGKRSDAASSYLYPVLDTNKNVTLLVRKRVVRVIFEGKRATGVEYVDDEGDHAQALKSPSFAYAARLVVLSAGAFGSPAILERSGIGAPETLRKNDVQQLVDLPGVGENLMDHNANFVQYHAADYADTLDHIIWGGLEGIKPFAEQWMKDGQGLMQHNGVDAGIRLRPTAEDLETIGPSFTERWNSYFANSPDKPIMLLASGAGYLGMTPNIPPRKFFCTAYYTAYPESSGFSHITSGVNPYAVLDYDPQYLKYESDLQVLVWAYKHSRELARRMPMYRGEVVAEHPLFPEGSEAAAKLADGPVPIDTPKIKYTEADNKAIEEHVKKFFGTTWHSCGTCSMKPRDKGGVVDEHLNVYGVENLKVADLSIIPGNVSANTYNTVIAIGEKAAVLIAQDLKIEGVTERGFGAHPDHDAHVHATLSAIQILIMQDALDRVDIPRVVKFIASLQQPSGVFAGDAFGEIDTRFLFCAINALSLLGQLDKVDTNKAVEYIQRCRNFDGGFGNVVGAESHSAQVYVCVATLAILDRLDVIDLDTLSWWLSERQLPNGGLNGRPQKLEDVCYSFWVLASLSIINKLEYIDADKLTAFILSAQDPEGGGIADRPGDMVDVFHTHFGMAGLSLIGYPGLEDLDPVYCMPERIISEMGLRKGWKALPRRTSL
ncbi:hypothetical protein NP233_g12447 [Leucocoprinus birnbaumii]|uniref:Geranylgeranyl transferase type-2 subunit beta n=1 Tax=Leucocoprinus birnbaumii TaxID=56174 RepID=A0AAD5YN24_9AGAR|nr:hypothetical protein NP233_g12447 [Leucocoprinus birnbaumii]